MDNKRLVKKKKVCSQLTVWGKKYRDTLFTVPMAACYVCRALMWCNTVWDSQKTLTCEISPKIPWAWEHFTVTVYYTWLGHFSFNCISIALFSKQCPVWPRFEFVLVGFVNMFVIFKKSVSLLLCLRFDMSSWLSNRYKPCWLLPDCANCVDMIKMA